MNEDLQARLFSELGYIRGTADQILSNQRDHENRIRSLEKYKTKITTVIALVTGIPGLVVAAFKFRSNKA